MSLKGMRANTALLVKEVLLEDDPGGGKLNSWSGHEGL